LISNEGGYQSVIPVVVDRVKPGAVYLGVGPEQNFAYIAAVRPQLAFIIDVRRGNLLVQLLYKALFEISADRPEFLSRLFSRRRPAGLTAASAVDELFTAYAKVAATDDEYEANLKAVTDNLTSTHHFSLSATDLRGIAHIYHDGFFTSGPGLNYAMGSGGAAMGTSPTYEELMLATDAAGKNRGYLATEENFAFVKALEEKNLIVPVVGDFGGPKALRGIGQYLKEHDGFVSTFYVSNVEQFLIQSGTWTNFCLNVGALPIDARSIFIYTGRGSPLTGPTPVAGNGLQSNVRPILNDVRQCRFFR
jgi:hypothetical protein